MNALELIFLTVLGLGLCGTGVACGVAWFGFTGAVSLFPVVVFLLGVCTLALVFVNSPFVAVPR